MKGFVTSCVVGVTRKEFDVGTYDDPDKRLAVDVSEPETTLTIKITGDINTDDLMSGPIEIVQAGKAKTLPPCPANGYAGQSNPMITRVVGGVKQDWIGEHWNGVWIDVRPSAVEPSEVIERGPCLAPQFFSANQWIGMAYAAVLLGMVQATFLIVRWL